MHENSEIWIPNVCKSNSNPNFKNEVWKSELCSTSLLTAKTELCLSRCSYDLLAKEKDALEAEFSDYRQQVQISSDDVAGQELRMLRGMVRSLEQELQTSRVKHQRLIMKRNKQCRLLLDEVLTVIICTLFRIRCSIIQGSPAKVRPTYIFDGNIWMHS